MIRVLSFILLSTAAALLPAQAQVPSQNPGNIPCAAPTANAPIWAKLTMVGNVVTCSYAKGTAQPTTWTQVDKPTTIGFVNDALLVGIYVTSHDVGAITSGTIDNVTITPSAAYRLADTDIGAPAFMGAANLMAGVWSISGSGADIWNTSDQFNFQPWLVWGDCTITCRITSLTTTGNPWEKIGIMIRDGYNTGADYAAFCASKSNGVSFQFRPGFNNNADKTMLVSPPTPGATSSVVIGYAQTGPSAYVLRP